MENKKSVSIRLNGKEHKYVENNLNKNWNDYQPERQAQGSHSPHINHTTMEDEVAATSESYIGDITAFGKKEKSKVNRKREKIVDLGSKREEMEEQTGPFWDDGKRDKSPKLPPHKRKKNRLPRFSFNFFLNPAFLAVIAAIIVGGAFGTVLLSIFTNGETVSTEIQSQNGGQPVVTENDSQVPLWGEEEGVNFVTPPVLNFHVVQAGAFSTVEKGMEEAAVFHDQGLPGVIHENPDLQYLFIGGSSDKEELELLTVHYETDLDITDKYVKQFIVEGKNGGVPEDWALFMEHGVDWLTQAATISINGIAGKGLDEEKVQTMIETGQEWTKAFESLDSQEENPLHDSAKEWVKAADEVVQLFSQSSISSETMWKTHQEVMMAMMNYDQLINLTDKAESQ
ncbi:MULTISPECIES: hypothetical protein [Bacillaceae]|uniref:Stage II sporulation protein B n=1 Tax=Evansella alkalicola TaxID=745819 RepID=A0ABS6JTT4_9BACI|nr:MULTISPECIES: hypothetical protein [Bacillaceae]MBU9721908.1 hypothetical protein [Bacillus alkalicola]